MPLLSCKVAGFHVVVFSGEVVKSVENGIRMDRNGSRRDQIVEMLTSKQKRMLGGKRSLVYITIAGLSIWSILFLLGPANDHRVTNVDKVLSSTIEDLPTVRQTILEVVSTKPPLQTNISYVDHAPSIHPSSQYPWVKNSTFLLQPHISASVNPDVVICVVSGQDRTDNRALVRETWAQSKYLNGKVSVVFVLGWPLNTTKSSVEYASIRVESEYYKDVLFVNMSDYYSNLSLKTLLSVTWATLFTKAPFIIKTDDDVLLNPYGWFKVSKTLQSLGVGCSITGLAWRGHQVLRHGKWAISVKDYNKNVYPTYCSGAAYLISRDAAQACLEVARYIPAISFEDVYLTGILAKYANVTMITATGIYSQMMRRAMKVVTTTAVLALHKAHENKVVWKVGWKNMLQRQSGQLQQQPIHLKSVTDQTSLPDNYQLNKNTVLSQGCGAIMAEVDTTLML